jgi:hypothetical protein
MGAKDRLQFIKDNFPDGMTESEAIDFYYYNIVGAYVGEHTPCYAEIL